jgi:hypothetical protein
MTGLATATATGNDDDAVEGDGDDATDTAVAGVDASNTGVVTGCDEPPGPPGNVGSLILTYSSTISSIKNVAISVLW